MITPAEVIAATRFIAERANGDRIEIHVRVGAPARRGDEWSCAVEVFPLHAELAPVIGEDAVQSLCLALGLASTLLRSFVTQGGKLYVADDADGEVPLDAYFGPFSASMARPSA